MRRKFELYRFFFIYYKDRIGYGYSDDDDKKGSRSLISRDSISSKEYIKKEFPQFNGDLVLLGGLIRIKDYYYDWKYSKAYINWTINSQPSADYDWDKRKDVLFDSGGNVKSIDDIVDNYAESLEERMNIVENMLNANTRQQQKPQINQQQTQINQQQPKIGDEIDLTTI